MDYGFGLWETPGPRKPWATSGRGSLPEASGDRLQEYRSSEAEAGDTRERVKEQGWLDWLGR
jgi:hypothetical protein